MSAEAAPDDTTSWPEFWSELPEPQRAKLRSIAMKYHDFVTHPLGNDGSILSAESCMEVVAWQTLDAEVIEAHSDWLARTKAKFERRGWPWTTAELARRSQFGEPE